LSAFTRIFDAPRRSAAMSFQSEADHSDDRTGHRKISVSCSRHPTEARFIGTGSV
jgi:hypothetical protein